MKTELAHFGTYRSKLQPPERVQLTELSNKIRHLVSALRVNTATLADYLYTAKNLVPVGRWAEYVEAELGDISLDTADRLALIGRFLHKHELPPRSIASLSKCTLYALAAPRVSDAVQERVARVIQESAQPNEIEIRQLLAAGVSRGRPRKPAEDRLMKAIERLAEAREALEDRNDLLPIVKEIGRIEDRLLAEWKSQQRVAG